VGAQDRGAPQARAGDHGELMNCPRCSASMRMVEPSPRWLRHFVCEECWSCWHIEMVRYLTTAEWNHAIRFYKHEAVLRFGRKTRFELAA